MTSEFTDHEAAFLDAGRRKFAAAGWQSAAAYGSLVAAPGRYVLPTPHDLVVTGELEIYVEQGRWRSRILAWGFLGVTSLAVERVLAKLSRTSHNASVGDEIVLPGYRDADVRIRSVEDAAAAGSKLAGEICSRSSGLGDSSGDLESYIAAAKGDVHTYRELIPVAIAVAGRPSDAIAFAEQLAHVERDQQYCEFTRRLTERFRGP